MIPLQRPCKLPLLALLLRFALLLKMTKAQEVIRIVPNTNNEGKFEGQVFQRLCSILGATGQVTFEWLHNDEPILSRVNESTGNLQLLIESVGLQDSGEYTCRANLSNGRTIGPNSAGTLTVLDRRDINAPRDQYALLGSPASLNCSYPGAFTAWYRNNITVSGNISSANISDEGWYMCDLYVPANEASIQMTIFLHVIVPIRITSQPPDHQTITGNIQKTLTVGFRGRMTQNIVATWYQDDTPLDASRAQTSFTGSENGITSLSLDPITRRDAGVYRVVVETQLGNGVIAVRERRAEVEFQVNVTVPPSVPASPFISDITSSQALIRWRLTNQTLDEGPDRLTLTVNYANNTQVRQYSLSAGTVEMLVQSIIPGMEYLVTVSASNQDGTRTTDPVSFQTLPGPPSISSVEVTRLNITTFNFSVSLAYTGGGNITHFRVSFRDTRTTPWTPPENIPVTSSPESSLVWNGIMNRDEFDTSVSLTFQVLAVNAHGLVSAEALATFPPTPPSSPPPTVSHIGSSANPSMPSSTISTALPTRSAPLVTIVAAAVCGSVVCTVVVMVAIFLFVCCCTHRKNTNDTTYRVNTPTDSDNKELEPENPMLHRRDLIPMHLRNSSIPSVSVSSSTIDRGTPSVRTPSDQSSTYKKYSPTTTTSSSPSILMFKQKRKWEISGASLETVESNVALSVSAQTNLDRNHANMGDNDTRPQMANNMTSSSETTLHHHHHHYPRISPSDSPAPGEVGKTVEPSSGNSFTSTSMFKPKHKWESSLETLESNIALRVSSQSNLDRNHANMGDIDTIPIDSNPSITVSSSTIDRGTPLVKNLRRTPSDQSSTYKKYSPTTTASSSPSILMFKQKRKWEISGASLETVESNVALSVSAQTNLDRNHANMGDNDTRPQMANNISGSETTLHHHHHYHYPSISQSHCKLENSGTGLEAKEKMLKQKYKVKSLSTAVNKAEQLGVQFIDPVEIISCDTHGCDYYNPRHDVQLRIPEEAILPSEGSIDIEFGVAMYGPFELTDGISVRRVSPVVWLCVQQDGFSGFQKDIKIIIPHFLDFSTQDACRYLRFLKASHQLEDGETEYQLKPADGTAVFSDATYGTLLIRHFCSVCIATSILPNEHTKYYLGGRISLKAQDCVQIIFYVCYFLKSCIRTVKQQMDKNGEEIYPIDFNFAGPKKKLKIKFNKRISGWILAMESPEKISAKQVDFQSMDKDELQAREDTRLYPPRFVITVRRSCPAPDSRVVFRFKGATKQIVKQVILTKATPLSPLLSSNVCPKIVTTPLSLLPSSIDLESVDGTTVLGEYDLQDVRAAVAVLAGKWKDLGLSLGLHPGDLDGIQSANTDSSSDFLRKMLSLWLKQSYYVPRFGKPTWRRLVEAVENRVGGNNPALAQEIARHHPVLDSNDLQPASAMRTSLEMEENTDDTDTHPQMTSNADTQVLRRDNLQSSYGFIACPVPPYDSKCVSDV